MLSRDGSVELNSPATTVALLKLNAMVQLQGKVEVVNRKDALPSFAVTCALRRSPVDNAFAPGIAKRLDGWASRDLNPSAMIALSPGLNATMKAVDTQSGRQEWAANHPVRNALEGIHAITSTGDGDDVSYSNRYVGITQMGT